MKKQLYLLGVIAVFCTSAFLSACKGNQGEACVQTSFTPTYFEENGNSVGDKTMKSYDLAVLREYFANSAINDILSCDTQQLLDYNQVAKCYPDGVLRSGENGVYTVYKVREGGNFYVFWAPTIPQVASQAENGLAVYFTAYLPSAQYLNEEAFSSLTVGKSTAADVKAIDPALEMNFNLSYGVYSCSYLDSDSVMCVYYGVGDSESYEGLVIQEITVVPRTDSFTKQLTCYARIAPEDLP